MFIAITCLMIVMGLVQVVRPKVLWGTHRSAQREDWNRRRHGADPSARRDYRLERGLGVLCLGLAVAILVTHL